MIGMLWLSQAGPALRRVAAATQLAGLGALIYLQVSGPPPGHGSVVLLAVTSLAWVGWVAAGQARRPGHRRPWLTLAVTGVLGVAGGLLAGLDWAGYAEAFPSVAVFAAGAGLPASWSLPVLAATEAAAAAGSLASRAPAGHLTPALLIPLLVYLAALNRRQVFLSREKEVEMAALAERARIAREIHDVLAHSLAGLSVQLEAARMLLSDRQDAGAALAYVERAQRLSTEGIAEARQAVAALREDVRPLPELLAGLVERHRATSGAATTLTVRGAQRRLSPEASLAVYRAAQEALTNAARHAPGSDVAAELRYGNAETVLTVTDRGSAGAGGGRDPAREVSAVVGDGRVPPPAGPAPSRGYGLAGMAERAELAGGTLQAGAFDGGWRVELRVPA